MIRPGKNKLIHWFFNRYILRIVERSFQSVNFNAIETDPDKAVLLIANHYSWWDGFLLYYLNAKLFKRNFRIMVLEQTMKEFAFFKFLGAYSVNKNTKGIIESLEYTAELLADPHNLVVIFPQGKIYSNFIDEVNFEKGLSRIINKENLNFQFVFAVSFIEHLQYKKATINVYLKNAGSSFKDLAEVIHAFQHHYQTAKSEQTKIVI